MHPRRTVAAVVAAATLTSGCSVISDQLTGAEASGVTRALPEPVLVTYEWGVADDLLSVVVENTTDRTLRYAEAVLEARSTDGELLVTSVETDPLCCAIHELGPGEQFGFYLDLDDATAPQVHELDVSYRNLSWAPTGTAGGELRVRARSVGLERSRSGAVVLADLVSDTSRREVVAQAVVHDSSDRLLAVVSGRWSCVVPGTRSIRMEFFHPLPTGAQVDRILVHPVDDDPTRPEPECAGDGSA